VGGDPDCPGALAQHRTGSAGVQPDHRPQQHRLGLLSRKGSDQLECGVGRQRVECAGSGVPGAGVPVPVAVRGGHDGWATGVDPAQVHRAVVHDRRGPASEPIDVPAEPG
jgi:hypothetical protein